MQRNFSPNPTRLTLELYKRVYLIRRAEEAIVERYLQDEMKTPVHLCIGQEAISAGICQTMTPEDQIISSYRSHGVYLARTLETDLFFAELYGKATGMAKGKAGSMHLSARKNGFFGSSAVVGTHIPVGVGAALANRNLGRKNFVIILFGDGAIDEGVFYESLNFASLHSLRVIFVCEDNDLAIHSPVESRHSYHSIANIVRQFPCEVGESDSTVAEEIYELTMEMRQKAEISGKPVFLYLKCYRYLEHVGINTDFQFGYRSEANFQKWKSRDPVLMQRKLLEQKMPEADIRKMEDAINQQILQSIRFAEESPFPEPEELETDLFSPSP